MTHLWDKPVAGKRCNYELWSVQTCFKGRVHQFHQSRVEPEAFLDATFSPYFRPATRTVEMGEVCGTLWVQTKYYSQKRRLNICHHTLHISLFNYTHQHMHAYIYIYTYIHTYIQTECPRRNVPDFGRVFLRSNYTDITQNTYIQSWTVTEIMARDVWNFDSYYSLIDYQIHIEAGRNMWFL